MQFAVRLVRRTMESVLRKGHVLQIPDVLPNELRVSGTGIYVAAYENPGRKPRGRVGSYLPTKPTLAEEIIYQTTRLLEAFHFRKEDLPHLSFELLLTRPPTLLADLSHLLPEYGLLVRTSRGKHGVSLPGIRARSPEERFADACAQGDVDPRIEDTRRYQFAVDTIAESS